VQTQLAFNLCWGHASAVLINEGMAGAGRAITAAEQGFPDIFLHVERLNVAGFEMGLLVLCALSSQSSRLP
jgi:hypothetical protein